MISEAAFAKRLAWNGGGIIPPGMAGHSPELGLRNDLERARQLLADAGHAQGNNLPILKYQYPKGLDEEAHNEIVRQLSEYLGFQIEIELLAWDASWWTFNGFHIQGSNQLADYPDPNCLRYYDFFLTLRNLGWRHPRFEELFEKAARTTDRGLRMAMYREADRILVDEEVVVVPWSYYWGSYLDLLKPWIKGRKLDALGSWNLKDITIEPHG